MSMVDDIVNALDTVELDLAHAIASLERDDLAGACFGLTDATDTLERVISAGVECQHDVSARHCRIC